MNINTTSKLIKTNIYTYGEPCEIKMNDGRVIETKTVTRRLWKNNRTKLEQEPTMLGMSEKNYLVAMFSFDTPIEDCDEFDTVTIQNSDYYFVRTDKITVSSTVQYFTSVLRKKETEDENVFN